MRCAVLHEQFQIPDFSPEMMPRRVRVDACAAIPINVAETTEASLDMTAEVAEAAPIRYPARRMARRVPDDEFC
jgi:hypothetical protein